MAVTPTCLPRTEACSRKMSIQSFKEGKDRNQACPAHDSTGLHSSAAPCEDSLHASAVEISVLCRGRVREIEMKSRRTTFFRARRAGPRRNKAADWRTGAEARRQSCVGTSTPSFLHDRCRFRAEGCACELGPMVDGVQFIQEDRRLPLKYAINL